MNNRISYLNTDLILTSTVDPRRLVEAFRDHDVRALDKGSLLEDGKWYVSFETDSQCIAPEESIRILLDAVDALSSELRQVWDACPRREFDIGFDCGEEPWAFNQTLSAVTLGRLAAVGGSLRITLYPNRD